MYPEPRAAQSAIIQNDLLIVFGGKDEENEKLNDVWAFNLKTHIWECYQARSQNETDVNPLPRSGHSASLYQNYMIIFGGILDVCKELDDMVIYDLERRQWVRFFEELMLSPIRQKYGGLLVNHDKDEVYTLTPATSSPEPTHRSSMTKFSAISPRLATSPDKADLTARRTPSRKLLSPARSQNRGSQITRSSPRRA